MAKTLLLMVLVALAALPAQASSLDPALESKVNAKADVIAGWGKDPGLVSAIKQTKPAEGMTQEAWEKLGILDPKLRELQSNAVGAWLKGKKEAWVAEAFVSAPDGSKLGLLAKTSSWSHKGKEKHEAPMQGKTWRGELEVDKSSGQQSIQVAVPVLDGATPIASLVVGIATSKL